MGVVWNVVNQFKCQFSSMGTYSNAVKLVDNCIMYKTSYNMIVGTYILKISILVIYNEKRFNLSSNIIL